MDTWESHLEDEAIVILVEPALKLQSRKLLEMRKALLKEAESRKASWMKICCLCLGHQNCRRTCGRRRLVPRGSDLVASALFEKKIDQWRTRPQDLPFSYLAIQKFALSRKSCFRLLAKFLPIRSNAW